MFTCKSGKGQCEIALNAASENRGKIQSESTLLWKLYPLWNCWTVSVHGICSYFIGEIDKIVPLYSYL